jgi:hypothetical protein
MTTTTATTATTTARKRIRFKENEVIDVDQAPTPGPTTAAKAFLSTALVSLPDSVKSFVTPLATKYNRLKSRERQQRTTLAKFSDDTYIPRSARINFELKCSESVSESNEFKTLSTTIATSVTAFQLELKAAMNATVELEIQTTQFDQSQVFFQTIHRLGSILYLANHPATKPESVPGHALARFLIEKQRGSLYKHLPLTPASVYPHYEKFAEDGVTYNIGDTPENLTAPFAAILERLNPAIEAIFVTSWDKQVEYYNERAQQEAIETQIRLFTVGTATEATAMQIDTEPTADATTIKDLVATSVAQKTKKLEKELAKLKQQLARPSTTSNSAKNVGRGATTPRAPSTNQKEAKTTPTTNTNPSNRRQEKAKAKAKQAKAKAKDSADESDNATSAAPRTNRRNSKGKNARKQHNARK